MIDIEKLREYVEAGDRIGYWTALDDMGDPYGKLALGVALNDTTAGATANGFFLRGALNQLGEGNGITPDELADISHKLMVEDFEVRRREDDGILDSRQIEDYHKDVFEEKGVTIEAWTAYAPLNVLGGTDDTVREAVWNAMLEGGLVRQGNIYVIMTNLSLQDTKNLAENISITLHLDFFDSVDLAQEINTLQNRVDASSWANSIEDLVFDLPGGLDSILRQDSGYYGGYTYEYTDPINDEQKTITGGTPGDDVIEGYDAPDPDAPVDPLATEVLSGDDILIGFAGDDTLIATGGTDRLYGGEGADDFVLTVGMGTTLILDAESDDRLLLRLDAAVIAERVAY